MPSTLGLLQVSWIEPLAYNGIRIRTFCLQCSPETKNIESGHVHKTSEIGTLIDTKCRPLAILQGQLAFSQWRSLVSPRSERTTSHGAGGNSTTTQTKVRRSTSSTTNELDRVEAATRAQGVPNTDSFFQTTCFGFLPYIYQTVASSKEPFLLLIAFKHTPFNFLQF